MKFHHSSPLACGQDQKEAGGMEIVSPFPSRYPLVCQLGKLRQWILASLSGEKSQKWGTWRSGKSAMKKRIESGKPPAGPDFPVKLGVVPIVGDG